MSQAWQSGPADQFPQQPMPVVRKGNGWAVASLICGILGCVPFITSLLATIFGIVGIRKSAQPYTSGKGLAIAGLVLGIIGIIAWGGLSGSMLLLYRGSAEPRALARQFVQDLAAGNIEAAMSRCASSIDRKSIEEASQRLQKAGSITNLMIVTVRWQNVNGVREWNLAGPVTLSNQEVKQYAAVVRREGADYKIVKFTFD